MYCVHVRSRDKIVAEMDNIKIFKTKDEAELFLKHIKENGLIGIDFDYTERHLPKLAVKPLDLSMGI